MSPTSIIALVIDTAEKINKLCDQHGADAGLRERMHSVHGSLIARGAASQDEILRVIESALAAASIAKSEHSDAKSLDEDSASG